MAVIFASALPICSPNASPCISVLLWTCMDIVFFPPVCGQFSVPASFLCGSAAVCCLSCPVGTPPPWLIGAALCCPTFLLCGPLVWLVRAAVSCAWSNHVAPPIVTSHGSVKRQGPPSTCLHASPSQPHALEQSGWTYWPFACIYVSDVCSTTVVTRFGKTFQYTNVNNLTQKICM